MSRLVEITEGWTAPLRLLIEEKLSGATVFTAKDLTNYTVTLGMFGNGLSELLPGTITKLNQTTDRGWITYLPDDDTEFPVPDENMKVTYYVHAIIRNSDGEDVTAPHGAATELIVHRRVPSA